jgi:hypothetical protein
VWNGCGNSVVGVSKDVVRNDEMRHAKWDHGVPAEGLLEDGRHVWQQRLISKVRKAVIANYGINLCLRFSLHIRVENHRKEERMEHRHSLRSNIVLVYHYRIHGYNKTDCILCSWNGRTQ